MSHVADTSFLVAFFDAQDRRHEATRKAFQEARPLVVPAEVLVELLGVLKAKAGRPAALAAFRALLRIPDVEWDERADVVGAYERMQREGSLSYVDAAVIQCALRRRADLLSHDQQQVAAWDRAVG